MLRVLRNWKLIKYIYFKSYSNSLGNIRHDIQLESFQPGCINYDFKLCDFKLDEISHKIDMIELHPYEIFFNSEEQTEIVLNTPKSNKEAILSDNIKYYNILDGFNNLINERSLPKKIRDVMHILNAKMLSMFPGYFKRLQNKNDFSKFAYDFIAGIIANNHTNAVYLDVCIQKGDYEKAFKLMKQIRTENLSFVCLHKKSVIVDTIFYEPAINLFGKKGKLDVIVKLLNEMDSLNILPSISIIFRSFEASSKKNNLDEKFISRLIQYIEKHKVSLEDAFIKAPITKDNFPHVIKAIKIVNQKFNITSKETSIVDKTVLKNTQINANINELEKIFDLQLMNEQMKNISLDPIYKFDINETVLKKLKLIEENWKNILTEAFEKKVAFLTLSDRSKMYPFLSVLPVKSYIDAMIHVVYKLTADNALVFTSIRNVYFLIGDTIYNMYRYRCLKKQKYFSHLKSIYLTYFAKLSANPFTSELDKLWEESILENIESGNLVTNEIEWDQSIKLNIGRIIYEIMFENLNFTFVSCGKEITTPVLYEQVEEGHDNVYISVKVQSKLKNIIRDVEKNLPTFSPLEMPMLHPPVPFHNNYKTGQFYLSNYATRMIRQGSKVNIYDDDLVQTGDMSRIYNALNVLGLCSWKIDNDNLELMSKVFNKKGNMELKIPLFSDQIPIPEISESNGSVKEKISNRRLLFNYAKDKKEMYSLWATVFYKLSIAKKFKDRQIWFPYSMDFRSRVYPCSPHLSHIGDDVSRGLLKFSYGKKLGPRGLNWLKIHAINLSGTHKRSPKEDRLKAANENLSDIIDSAIKPLEGRGWWKNSEKPWQTLLACREIFYAEKFADEEGKGSPDQFVSHLGIHQDGSCNGLQHYAALGKDLEGAKAVNLIDNYAPQDVYSDVLDRIIIKQKNDAAQGIKEAIELDGLLNRKIIKQSVMTTVYGVTQFGAKEQIQRQLKELNQLPPDSEFRCSVYLSKITLNSIGEIFSSATKIKNWLVELASAVGKLRNSNISWETPLNMIAMQPYFNSNSDTMKPNIMKNKNAFPPNFVHSLDSSHMMLTALRCWQENITFISVHDCFWTHACDVDAMNKICREEFVKLHSQPILENLSKYLFEKYGFHKENKKLTNNQLKFNTLLLRIPQKGSLNIDEVIKSTYFFS